MPLKLRPTGLGAGIDKDRPDFTVYSGGWAIGRIYETRGGPDSLRWFWSIIVTCPMTRSDQVATLEESKAQFRRPLGRLDGVDEAAGDAVAPCVPLLIIELSSKLQEPPVESTHRHLTQRSPDTAGLFIDRLFQELPLDITH